MKILYKQPIDGDSAFAKLDAKQCYLKHLCVDSDVRSITNKPHHHNGFEIHIIENGHQTYAVGEQTYRIGNGEFLLIPPRITHCVLDSAPQTSKFSVTFDVDGKSIANMLSHCFAGSVCARVKANISHILAEREKHLSLSPALVENSVFETVVLLLRACGMKEEVVAENNDPDLRYLLAVQYIQDNIEHGPKSSEVARYCYLSNKQLTRIFLQQEDTTVSEYIRKKRCAHIEMLLADSALTLREISEKMNFNNEYYFHAFFKRYAGMSPGAYRKSISG